MGQLTSKWYLILRFITPVSFRISQCIDVNWQSRNCFSFISAHLVDWLSFSTAFSPPPDTFFECVLLLLTMLGLLQRASSLVSEKGLAFYKKTWNMGLKTQFHFSNSNLSCYKDPQRRSNEQESVFYIFLRGKGYFSSTSSLLHLQEKNAESKSKDT